jgi:hypothetical protein
MRDVVLRATWWDDARVQLLDAQHRMVLLYLTAQADRDGIVQVDSAQLVPLLPLGAERLDAVAVVRRLEQAQLLALWSHNDIIRGSQTWAWLVRQHEDQPTTGALALPRCSDRPAPPRDVVLALLERQLGRPATAAEGKRASPRSWGLVRQAAPSAAQEVERVWAAWRDRQARPGACVLAEAVQRQVRAALQQATADQLVQLVAFAYEADEPAARFWRGQNDQRRTYLGLDNLLRLGKLADRLQLVEQWVARQQPSSGGDGTDLGPLAAYRRRGPAGTTSSPDPRPHRLAAQCAAMLQLFVRRGPEGVRTHELAELALKYSSRISELRGYGADIVMVERNEDGDNVYQLINVEHVAHLLDGGDGGLD